MPLDEPDILRILMKSRSQISAAAWLIVRDTQAAEDIFQDVVLKAMTRETHFTSEAAVMSWGFIAARREGIDWLRRRKKEPTTLHATLYESLQEEWLHPAEAPRLEALRECMRRLPESARSLFRLRYVEGYACAEVADRLGSGRNAIYKRLSRLHQALRECVESRIDPEVRQA